MVRRKSWLKWGGIVIAAVALITTGYIVGGMGGSRSSNTAGWYTTTDETASKDLAAPEAPVADSPEMRSMAPQGDAGSTGQDAVATDRLVIKNASAAVRVDDLDEAIDRVRSFADKYGAEVADLWIDRPSDGDPRPLTESGAQGPANAQVTLRVPAERLDALIAELDSLGTVTNQTSSSSDVTEQHVDMSARLANLKAEEARLRDFFEQAKDVKDLLAVQSELSRVRGEIEAMQAQVDYLERQSARATLTVSLTEPGPVVRPGGTDWGFREAVTEGFQAAVFLLTSAITAIIAVSPLLLLAGLLYAGFRFWRRRHPNVMTTDERPGPEEDL